MLHTIFRSQRPRGNVLTALYISLMSLVLCMVCLAGTSWSWFHANQSLSVDPIHSAKWELESVQVFLLPADVQEGEAPISVETSPEEDGAVTFCVQANTRCRIRTAVHATASHGFLQVTTCDGTYYTTEPTAEFTLVPSQNGYVRIWASWGAMADNWQTIAAALGTESHEPIPFVSGEELGAGAVCICRLLCFETVIEETCPLCTRSREDCAGSMPECICTAACKEEAPNSECPACHRDLALCSGCSCTDYCQEEVREDCPACAEDSALCTGQKPLCTCETLCTDTERDVTCPVCPGDTSACQGKPPCVCTELCTETGNQSCPACMTDKSACKVPAPPQETQPQETQAQETPPQETQPQETQPQETQPQETQPQETQPQETQPQETQPQETQPQETQPQETELQEMEPDETEPPETDPPATEPEGTE